ncbi:nitrate reductase molybdenum cofactor assembly chaperone [Brachybacterium sp. YJGR34]|uniref:nitrate reductase molybdenum cofactor assembly chaperone n=1 Tax=Brachybacterium sp. YJGR34 TaxID=2059911 RepID=UPI000E0B21D7|nr:nitrate reductase molybdenum cofactor assembly chaperone [Brachybacterium sp. YJGR34]
MGALARLLGRRDGGPGAATASSPRGRAGKDQLHASGMTTEELRICWIAVSWMLTYPEERTIERFTAVRELAGGLPDPARTALLGSLHQLSAQDPVILQEQYVDTFDTRRRGCLHLTYFSHGDTRRRGMALLRIKQDFRAAGLVIGAEELPDHLPVVLEFAAAHDAERGAKILRANRPGVELLRLHLADIGSPWHGALVALCATLPPLDADDRAAVLRLAEEGPEEELVGLDGYGADGFGLDGAAGDLAGQTSAASSCGSGAAAPGPVPVDLMRGRPS